MATLKQLITQALGVLGEAADGEEPSNAALKDGLLYCEQMLDSWSNENLLIATRIQEVFHLAEKAVYTVGKGADLDTERPIKIELLRLQDENSNRIYPIKLISAKAFSHLPKRNTGQPENAYYEAFNQQRLHDDARPFWDQPDTIPLADSPYGILRLDAVPKIGAELTITSTKPLHSNLNLHQTLQLPQGYERLIRNGLVLELAPHFGQEPPAMTVQSFIDAKANIKRTIAANQPRTLSVDSALSTRNRFGASRRRCR